VILLCFPVDKIRALGDIRTRWQEEIDEYAPDAALVLVGTKADMRDGNSECIAEQDVQVLLSELSGEGYFEVSARNVQGVYDLFKFAAEIGLKKKNSERRCCCLIS
jgi:GTPase SAR1 family protein